jgi:prolyl 4-hydroxylase
MYIIIFVVLCIYILYFIEKINNNTNFGEYKNRIKNISDDNYDVIIIDNFLSNKECDNLINYSKTKELITSETLNDNGNVTSDYRKSEQIWIKDNENKIAKKISDLCEELLDLPKKNMESLQFVRYDVNGYFKVHYDAEPNKEKKTNIKDRAHTFMVYLNDVDEGGETEFPKLKLKIKPKKGRAVYFKTLLNNGELLLNSLHQGMPIIRGEKYIINKWIHLNEFEN